VKIVFWGTPNYAAENLVSIINSGYEVIAVVTQPDKKRNRGKKISPSPVKKTAIDFGIPVYTTQSISKDQNTMNILFNLDADVYIVVAFGQILPKEILDHPKLGCWNSHASLLPVWRGAAPIQWSIINEDSKTGICIMAMEEGLDTGPVIELESTIISDTDNLEILTNRLCHISSKLLVKALENIKKTIGLNKSERLIKLNAIDQSNLKGNPSYARQISKSDYLIDWRQDSRKIIKRIQGLFPNAYTIHNGKRIKIVEAQLLSKNDLNQKSQLIDTKFLKESVPGQIIKLNHQKGIIVMTNDIPILIKCGQLEGKNRTDGYTLSIQSNLRINNIFGSNDF
tara:strand:+ start:864 stop:1883 length:1020 start_codon:yes stop_codon:yes gene_type:complete